MEPIILASESPRRREFLTLLGLPFTCLPSNVDESFEPGAEPRAVAEELAIRKVSKTAENLKKGAFSSPFCWICGADTIISLNGRIYGKALDRKDAGRMLRAFQGNTHEVISAVALCKCSPDGVISNMDCRSSLSKVSFAPMSEAEVEWYLDSGEWQDAAGAYKLQGLASCFISRVEGSYSSIVGLPLREFYAILRDNGYPYGASYSP